MNINLSNNEKTIIVLGSPRSGTSMTAGILDILRVDLGNLRPSDAENPRGYFEDIDFNNLMIKIFKRVNPKANGFNPPNTLKILEQKNIFDSTIKQLIFNRRHNKKSSLWGWKVTTTCFTLPLFIEYLVAPHFVIVTRNIGSTAKSMVRYTKNKAFYKPLSENDAISLHKQYYSQILKLKDLYPEVPKITISYEELIRDPKTIGKSISNFLGILINEKQLIDINTFVLTPEEIQIAKDNKKNIEIKIANDNKKNKNFILDFNTRIRRFFRKITL